MITRILNRLAIELIALTVWGFAIAVFVWPPPVSSKPLPDMCTPTVGHAMQEIWQDTFSRGAIRRGIGQNEHAFTLSESGDVTFYTGTEYEIAIPHSQLQGLQAIVHTHVDGYDPTPSSRDVLTAQTYNLSVYVLSRAYLYRVGPSGIIVEVGRYQRKVKATPLGKQYVWELAPCASKDGGK